MKFHPIEHDSTTIQSEIEAIEVSSYVPIAELKQRFPNVKHSSVEISHYASYTSKVKFAEYLEAFCEAFPLETLILHLRDSSVEALPKALWSTALKHLTIYSEVSLNIEPPADFQNHLETIVFQSVTGTIAPNVLSTPTLKSVKLLRTNSGLKGLEGATYLEHLVLNYLEFDGDLNLAACTHLRHLEINGGKWNTLPFLGGCVHLEYLKIELNCVLSHFVNNWEHLQQLKHFVVYLTQPTNYKGLKFKELRQLKTLHLTEVAIEPHEPFLGEMPQLENLTIQGIHATSFQLPAPIWDSFQQLQHLKLSFQGNCVVNGLHFRQLTAIKTMVLEGFQVTDKVFELGKMPQLENLTLQKIQADHLQILENQWDTLNELKHLTLHCKHSTLLKGLSFKTLAQLQTLLIHGVRVEGKTFLGKMPVLESFTLQHSEAILSDTSFKSPKLKVCHLEMIQPACLPTAVVENVALTHLYLRGDEKLFVPKEVLLKRHLLKFDFNFPRYAESIMGTALQTDFMEAIQSASDAQRLVIGQLLLEGLASITDWASFRKSFLDLLNARSPALQFFVYKHLDLLNANFLPFELPLQPADYQHQSIAFVGGMSYKKVYYEEKCAALNIDYQSITRKDVNWIVLGKPKGVAVPVDFWSHPHAFITEDTFEIFLAKVLPAFLQTAEKETFESLQKLIGSGDAKNDLLVLEMVKTGGIPLGMLSDLVTVVCTSEESLVRNGFRALIKPFLPYAAHTWITKKFIGYDFEQLETLVKDIPQLDFVQMKWVHEQRGKSTL